MGTIDVQAMVGKPSSQRRPVVQRLIQMSDEDVADGAAGGDGRGA